MFLLLLKFYLSAFKKKKKTQKVSGEVFLPHSAGLLAPRLAGALLPESTQG